MSRDARKPVFDAYYQDKHKPACAVIKDDETLTILQIEEKELHYP